MKKKSIGHLPVSRGRASLRLYAALLALFVLSACTQPGGNDPVISITTQPADTTVKEGSISGSLSVTASVTEDAELAYRWYSNTSAGSEGGTIIEGATTASFTIPTALTAGTYYYFCEISAPGAASVRSAAAKVTVESGGPVITISAQPAGATVTEGSITGSLSVTASITGGAELAHQWYSNTAANNEGGTKETGVSSTTASFTIPTALTEGSYYYFCEITAAGAASVRSDVAKVTVNLPDDDEVPVYHITTQPLDVTVSRGNISGELTVDAEVTEGSTTLSYHWYKANSADDLQGTEIQGATGKSFAIPKDLAEGIYYYFCEVRGGMATQVHSDIAKVTVTKAVPAINISAQPAPDTTVKAGEITGSLSVTAVGTGGAKDLTYQWYSNTENKYEDAARIEGETKTSFAIPQTLTAGVYYYFCEITAAGVANPKRSGIAKVTVNNLEIGIVIELNEEQELVEQTAEATAGDEKEFSVTGDWETYQWYLNGAAETGETSPSYTFNKPAGLYTLTVVVTDDAGDRYSGSCVISVR